MKRVSKKATVKKSKPTKTRKGKTQLDYVEIDHEVKLKVYHHFCIRGISLERAVEVKTFVNTLLKLQESKLRFEVYQISPYGDFTWYFHKSDELDLPESVKFYTYDSFFQGKHTEIKKDLIIKRSEEDFKNLEV